MGVGGLLALGVVLGCGASPSVVKAEGGAELPAEESTFTDDDGDGGSEIDGDSGTEGEAASAWPEELLGRYYEEDELPLGVPAMYLGILTNIELRRDSLQVTFLGCHGTEKIEQLAVSFEGAEAHVRPQPEQTHVLWNGSPVAKELVIRPGSTCAELETELIEPIHADFAAPWKWRLGSLYITDSCGDEDSVWGADLSPDVPTECDEAD